jgi:plasmid stabilization system protein ParE
MSYSYSFLGKAQEEYERSVNWYAERSLQASAKFVTAVDATLKLICDNPVRWRNRYKNYYELGVKKYPFSLIYIIEPANKLIVITAVYHGKRNPKRRYRKLK